MRSPMMMGPGLGMRAPMFQPPPQMQQAAAKQEQEVKEQIKEDNSKSMSEVTGNMVDTLANSANPKHRNCKFLRFLNKLNSGAYEIKEE